MPTEITFPCGKVEFWDIDKVPPSFQEYLIKETKAIGCASEDADASKCPCKRGQYLRGEISLEEYSKPVESKSIKEGRAMKKAGEN